MPSPNTIKLNEERAALRAGGMRVISGGVGPNHKARRKYLQNWCRLNHIPYSVAIQEIKKEGAKTKLNDAGTLSQANGENSSLPESQKPIG